MGGPKKVKAPEQTPAERAAIKVSQRVLRLMYNTCVVLTRDAQAAADTAFQYDVSSCG